MKNIILALLLITSITALSAESTDCTQFAHDATAYEEDQLGVNYDFNTYLEVMNEWNIHCESMQ